MTFDELAPWTSVFQSVLAGLIAGAIPVIRFIILQDRQNAAIKENQERIQKLEQQLLNPPWLGEISHHIQESRSMENDLKDRCVRIESIVEALRHDSLTRRS